MVGGKIKCVARRWYRVVMDDGKLFNIIHSEIDNLWKVYADKESPPESRVGEFKTLAEAKQAVADDFSKREYKEYEMVWYGTKWGLAWDEVNDKPGALWRGTKPDGWKFDFLKDG